MADDIKELTFSNHFYNNNGTPTDSYNGRILVDFTTNRILNGNISAGSSNYAPSSDRLGLTKASNNNLYTINVNNSEDGAFNGTLTFTGTSPTYFNTVSLKGHTIEGSHNVGFSEDTSNTTASERSLKAAKATPSDFGPPALSIDQTTSGFENGTTPILNGTVSDSYGPVSVEIFNGHQDLGAAAVNDGTWTFMGNLGSGDYADLTAVATPQLGTTTSANASFELVTGIQGEPYHALEYDHDTRGSYGYTEYGAQGKVLVTAANNSDGTHDVQASENGQILYSVARDTMTGNGSNETFVFTQGFAKDEVTDFAVTGSGHDTIDLTNTQMHTLAQVIAHTSQVGANAVLHLFGNETVTLDGVTKAQLKAHPGDFLFA